MASRMDRYSDSNKEQFSRSKRNEELYENLGSNTRYTNITDVTNANAFNLENVNNEVKTRESYHKIKDYQEPIFKPKEQRELEDFNYLYQDHENRIYDINRILEEAHKNRVLEDDKEEKRKLKSANYNITNLSKEELENYRKERTSRKNIKDEEEIRELIDTITSKTLAGEISQATGVDLLSDLMATNILDKIEAQKEEPTEQEEKKSPEISKEDDLSLSREVLDQKQLEKIQEVREKEEINDTREQKLKNADTDFYTRSMDLSDKDFEMEDDFIEEKTSPLFKIITIIISLVALAAVIYFIWQNFG